MSVTIKLWTGFENCQDEHMTVTVREGNVCLFLMLQVEEKRVPRDAGHPHYPFNDPY